MNFNVYSDFDTDDDAEVFASTWTGRRPVARAGAALWPFRAAVTAFCISIAAVGYRGAAYAETSTVPTSAPAATSEPPRLKIKSVHSPHRLEVVPSFFSTSDPGEEKDIPDGVHPVVEEA